MKLTASLLVVFTLFYCTCAHVSYSNWRLIDTVCRRPNSGECAKAGTCCGKKLSGTQRLERDCEHDACPPDMLEKTQGCTIRCGDADATAYGAWVRAGNCERPSSGACAAEDTCCGQREGTMKHTRECNAANGCDAPTLERHFKCNVRCGFVNPCRLYPNPCENGGTCVEDGHSHSCTCASGWTGHHCDEDVDECASEPCQNGGTCTDGVNTYSCDCADGFSGGDCSTNVDECASEPCQNGGVCTDGDNTYSCDCADGFSGGDCSTKDVVEDEDNGEWCTDPLKSSQDATDFPADFTNLGYANNYAYVWTSEGGEYADVVAHCAKFNAKPAHHNMDSFEGREKIIDSFNKEDVFDQLWIGMEIKDGAWQYIDGSTGDFVWGSWEAANGATTPDFSYDGNNGLMNSYPGQKDHLKSSYWNDESYGFYHGLCEIECPSAPADDTPAEEPVPPATPLCSDATWLQASYADGEDNTGDGYSPWNGGEQDSQEACYQKCIEMTKTYPDINAIGYGIEGRSVKSCSCYPASTGFIGEWKAESDLGRWGTNRVFCMMPEAEAAAKGEFSEWGSWEECSTSCGEGTQSRSRTCDGENCEGDATETETCTMYKNCDSCAWVKKNTVDNRLGNGAGGPRVENIASKEACEVHCLQEMKTNTKINIVKFGHEGYSKGDCTCIENGVELRLDWQVPLRSRWSTNSYFCWLPDYNGCYTRPCQNGASCTDEVDGYSCDCPKGYSGKNCEFPPGTCGIQCTHEERWFNANINSLAGKTYTTTYEGKTVTFSPCSGLTFGEDECVAMKWGDQIIGVHGQSVWRVSDGASLRYLSNTDKIGVIDVDCDETALEAKFEYGYEAGGGSRAHFKFEHICFCAGKCDDNGVITE